MLLPCGNGLDHRHVRSAADPVAHNPSQASASSHQAVERRKERRERLNMKSVRNLLTVPTSGNGLIAAAGESFIQGDSESTAEGQGAETADRRLEP